MHVFVKVADKIVKFAAIHGNTQKFAVMAQIRKFHKSHDGCKNYTSLLITIHCYACKKMTCYAHLVGKKISLQILE